MQEREVRLRRLPERCGGAPAISILNPAHLLAEEGAKAVRRHDSAYGERADFHAFKSDDQRISLWGT